MIDRIEGQIWISREEPNVLKYFARDKEYWAVSATTYVAGEPLSKGMVIAADRSTIVGVGERVIKAVWPRDAENIVGIALNAALTNETVRVLNYGYIRFVASELASVFITKSDLVAMAALQGENYYTAFGNIVNDGGAGNGWADDATTRNGRSAKVYWFCGRTYKTGINTYGWADPSAYAGKLTFATPSGYKPTGIEIPWNDDSLNISYKQLPVIGNVVDYTVDANYNITELIIHVNFTKFQRKIQFEYPAADLKEYSVINDPQTLVLRHGLFANNEKPHVEISMWGYTDPDIESSTDGETIRIWPGYDSYIGSGADKRTEVEIASDSPFYYKILGEVSYNK